MKKILVSLVAFAALASFGTGCSAASEEGGEASGATRTPRVFGCNGGQIASAVQSVTYSCDQYDCGPEAVVLNDPQTATLELKGGKSVQPVDATGKKIPDNFLSFSVAKRTLQLPSAIMLDAKVVDNVLLVDADGKVTANVACNLSR